MALPKAAACKECGTDPVHHRLTYITVALDETLRPIFAPGPFMRFIGKGVYALERVVSPRLLQLFVKLGWAKAVAAPDDDTMLLAKMLWEEAGKRGIEVREIRLGGLARNLFLAKYPDGRVIAYEGIPLPPSGLAQAPWMDNKAEMKRRFRTLGIPVAAGGAAFTEHGARSVFQKVVPPVIVKPYSGSASRHTNLHITNELKLFRAFHSAKKVAPLALIEEELVGPVFRATVVDGKFAAALRRDPPHVIGDGMHTVEQLIEEANKNPQREGPYFSKMQITAETLLELKWQNLTPESIPEKGRRVTLHQKVNWSLGGTTADVTDEVHADNVALFEQVAHVLKAPIVGMDVIIGDMSRSWRDQERCGIIECNSMPFFDNHHLPFEGKPRNVAGLIWDMVEPKNKQRAGETEGV
ncbi:MAG TPA: hypothetical protein PK109_02460 [Candidatus Paceibacterota bacterium]|nr:hypothetical protein [Candidatus Paceibacterota bacterium]